MSSMSFILQPIRPVDVPECARIASLAFERDRHTLFKSLDRRNPYNHEESMRDALQQWLSRPSGAVEMTKAIDTTSGKIIGWVVWGFRGFNSAAAEQQRETELKDLAALRTSSSAGLQENAPTSVSTEEEKSRERASSGPRGPPRSVKDSLESFTGADMAKWMKRLMPLGVKCMYICSLAVEPQHQGRGVGSSLLHLGTDRADAENVYCWVHASEVATDFYMRHAFHEVGRLEVDLDRWNSERVCSPSGEHEGWGTYTFKYMRREPRRC